MEKNPIILKCRYIDKLTVELLHDVISKLKKGETENALFSLSVIEHSIEKSNSKVSSIKEIIKKKTEKKNPFLYEV